MDAHGWRSHMFLSFQTTGRDLPDRPCTAYLDMMIMMSILANTRADIHVLYSVITTFIMSPLYRPILKVSLALAELVCALF